MRPRRSLESATWVIGICLLLAYGAMRAWSASSSHAAVAAFEAANNTGTAENALPPEPSVDQSLWSAHRIAAFSASKSSQELPAGVLRIPALRLVVPIYEGTGSANLNRGAGRVEGTAPLGSGGNVGIAAHRDGFFRKLKDAEVGQTLHLQTRAQTLLYRIVETQVVDPTDVSVLAPTSRPTVTLVTCYPFYFVGSAPQRFIVRAETDADFRELAHASGHRR
jgi:sortase A